MSTVLLARAALGTVVMGTMAFRAFGLKRRPDSQEVSGDTAEFLGHIPADNNEVNDPGHSNLIYKTSSLFCWL